MDYASAARVLEVMSKGTDFLSIGVLKVADRVSETLDGMTETLEELAGMYNERSESAQPEQSTFRGGGTEVTPQYMYEHLSRDNIEEYGRLSTYTHLMQNPKELRKRYLNSLNHPPRD